MGRCDVDQGCSKWGQCWCGRTDGGPGPRVVGPTGAKFKGPRLKPQLLDDKHGCPNDLFDMPSSPVEMG